MAISIKAMKESLIIQLKNKGGDVDHFLSLIDDYCFYWKMQKKMQTDVRKNGVMIEKMSASGVEITVENPCVKDAVMYNKQMLAILREMGLTTSGVTPKPPIKTSPQEEKPVKDEECDL